MKPAADSTSNNKLGDIQFRIEQLESEKDYLERIGTIEKDNALRSLFSELYVKLGNDISELYTAGRAAMRTPPLRPRN